MRLTRTDFRHAFAIILAFLLCANTVASSAGAGPVSQAVEMARDAAEYAGKRLSSDVAASAVSKLPEHTSKFPEPIRAALQRLPSHDAAVVARHLDVHKLDKAIPSGAAEDAIAFLVRNGDNGALVLKRFGWDDASRYGLTRTNADEVVRESGLLIRPGLEGNWGRLRTALSNAGATGRDRDFAEVLFADRASAGRIPGLENVKLFPAQHNGLNGIDFIAVDNGKLRVIEFGTGRKPTRIAGQDINVQMDWLWIEKNFQTYLRKLDGHAKINLREAGFPNDLILQPELLTGERLRRTVQREIFAVEPDGALLRRLGNDVSFHCLDLIATCTSRIATRLPG